MPLLTEAARRIRTSGPNPTTDADRERSTWWQSWPWGGKTLTGETVSDETALTLTAFYRGVTLIASACAGLPMHVYRETEVNGVGRRDETPATRYLWGRPNPEMSRISMWERVFADEVRGNAFVFVEKDAIGRVESLWWLDRKRVQVGRAPDDRKVYLVDGEIVMMDYSAGGEIVHIPNWGDGLVGYDIVKLAAQAISLGLSAEKYAANTFGQGSVPPGIITTDQVLTPKQARDMSEAWDRRHAGTANSQRVAVFGLGAKFQPVARDMAEMEMRSLRSFQVGDIARLLGIAPHLLGDIERSTSWGSGIAEQGEATVRYSLMPHLTRVKQAIDDALLVNELTGQYVEFDAAGLLRGSLLQRYQAHAIAFGRFLTANEIRQLENLPPVDGGDELLAPVNLAPLEAMESMEMEAATAAAGAPPDLPEE